MVLKFVTLNAVNGWPLFCVIAMNSVAVEANYTTVVEVTYTDRNKNIAQGIYFSSIHGLR